MTQASIFDVPVSEAPPVRKKTRLQLVVEFFEANPNEWIDGMVIRSFAGGYGGWSARIREARDRYGMRIENRQTHRPDGSTLSEYIYIVPSSERQE